MRQGLRRTCFFGRKCNFAKEYGSVQSAIAGAMIDADLSHTAKFDPAAVYANLARFSTAVPPAASVLQIAVF